mgnify:CR=1 FL=1
MTPANRRMLIAFLAEVALFVLSSIAFFQGFQILCTDLYDFTHVLMVWPMFLTYSVISYWLFSYHSLLHQPNKDKRGKMLFVNAIIFIALGVIFETLVIVNIANGSYVMGWINKMFPVDLILINLVTIGLGVFSLLKKEWIADHTPALLKDYEASKPLKIAGSILWGIYALIQEYLFGGYILSGTFLDANHKGFGEAIPLLTLCLLGAVLMCYREIVLFRHNGKRLSKKTRLIAGSILLGFVFANALYVLILNFTPASQYIALNLQGFFVLDYIASLNLAPYLTSIPPLIVVILMAVRFFIGSKQYK